MKTIVAHANGRGYTYNRVVEMVTLDVQNAFNSALRLKILEAAVSRNVPPYVLGMISNNLPHRNVIIKTAQATERVEMSCGVPQGLVLGPDLWNLLYNDLM